MGQGYHSKLIVGAVLTEAQAAIYNAFSDEQNDEFSDAQGRHNITASYNIEPLWFGVILGTTDEWVAKKKKILDIGAGISLSELNTLAQSTKSIRAAQQYQEFCQSVEHIINLDEGEVRLVSDYD